MRKLEGKSEGTNLRRWEERQIRGTGRTGGNGGVIGVWYAKSEGGTVRERKG